MPQDFSSCYDSAMRNLVVLFIHFIKFGLVSCGPSVGLEFQTRAATALYRPPANFSLTCYVRL